MSRTPKAKELTFEENKVIESDFHSKLIEKLNENRREVEPLIQELEMYRKEIELNATNEIIKDLQQAHIEQISYVLDSVKYFDSFMNELDTEDRRYWLRDTEGTADEDTRLYRELLKIYSDERQFNGFVSIVYESILQEDRESFYYRMCNLFENGIEVRTADDKKYASTLVGVEKFTIRSEMARQLANVLFRSNNENDVIKKKKEGEIELFNMPYELKISFKCKLFGTTSSNQRKGKKDKELSKFFL